MRRLLLAVILVAGCHGGRPSPEEVDRSFCRISAQRGKPVPTDSEIARISGRYLVSLYSADSGKVLSHLDFTLLPTDSLHRFYGEVHQPDGTSRRVRREFPLLAVGDERGFKRVASPDWPSVMLFYRNDQPIVSVFAPPKCVRGACVINGSQQGLLLNIRQVKSYGFAGTVDQIGTVTSMQAPGHSPQLLGPHFFCALRAS